ncbi:hypothetical protein OIE80_00680 [Streptomyces cellulosae]|nr:hypothetical protein OH715_34750 [Streptomyces cellulosae]
MRAAGSGPGGPWTAESGELTPKLSLRRRDVERLHGAVIESMYA